MGHLMETANCLAQSLQLRVALREASSASPAWQAFMTGALMEHNQVSCFSPGPASPQLKRRQQSNQLGLCSLITQALLLCPY